MTETHVVNIDNPWPQYAAYDVYIGRGSIWGNPFHARVHGRPVAIERYERHLRDQLDSGDITIQELMALQGQRLGCHCKPKACHGDVIVKLIAEHTKEMARLGEGA